MCDAWRCRSQHICVKHVDPGCVTLSFCTCTKRLALPIAMAAATLQCGAKWVLEQQWATGRGKPEYTSAAARPAHMAARRFKGPFFVWQASHGLHAHIGVHTGLYSDLIMLIQSLEESLKVVDAQVDSVAQYNATRVTEGRLLFGNELVDEARGGVFVLDVSAAQPHSASTFAVQQLAAMLEFWSAFHQFLCCCVAQQLATPL